MKITACDQSITEVQADAVVVGHYEDQPLSASAAELDRATGGVLSRLVDEGEIRGKAGEATVLLAPVGIAAGRIVVVGLGAGPLDRGVVFRAAGTAARQLATRPRERVVYDLADLNDEQIESGICGAAVACHGQDLYRREKKTYPFNELLWAGAGEGPLERGRILAEAVNLTRRLVNEPPCEAYPESIAASAGQMAEECGLQCEIWDRDRLEAEGCGALLAVARGSSKPPRLVILRHQGADSSQPPLALVGKGVTFDSGGLSLKPTEGMKAMKCDMAGAATVLGAMQAIARLKLPVNVIGLVGLVENMINGDAYKLGDVLHARNGKTIEVMNTDAEGRLVLADVLSVAVERGAERIVDLATLTGACVVALGLDVAGLMTNDQAWCDAVADAASRCGEAAWQLPMFPEFGEQIRSEVADIKNTGEGRWGGAITAAKFLEEFVDGKPWTHIDIAGPSFLERPKSWSDAGASGAFVRTLVEIASRR